jgi:alkyl hydroperoxide reductase subunit AhpC
MSLHLGDTAPDFAAETTDGKIRSQTPANWRRGDRIIVPPGMSTDEAKATFQNVEEIKPDLRYADAPSS